MLVYKSRDRIYVSKRGQQDRYRGEVRPPDEDPIQNPLHFVSILRIDPRDVDY